MTAGAAGPIDDNGGAGLSPDTVAALRARFGPNTLPTPRFRLLRLAARQFRGIFNLLLIAAAAVTFWLGETVEGAFILGFVAISTGLNLYQEYQSDIAAEKLKAYLLRTITVRRGGESVEVPVTDLVPGDVLLLEPGDIVPADAAVTAGHALLVDESTFTGESVAVAKRPGAGDEAGQLLQGVVILRGTATAVVTATGPRTRLAGLSAAASAIRGESQLVQGIDRISGFILRTTLITLALVVIANVLIDGREADVPHLLVFAVALAVSVIPEALPLVLTFSLSRGALRFAEKGVIVKRLSSVHDLGAVNLLCTDKTGTITENRLSLADVFQAGGTDGSPRLLARLAATGLHARIPEPFDLAVDESLAPEERAALPGFRVVEEEAFDPALRSNGVTVVAADGRRLHIRRGSPEVFAALGLIDARAADWLRDAERRGRRVLAITVDGGAGARLAGLLAFEDRLKPSTTATLEAARQLNLAITIITGDALQVARAVGEEAGLVSSGDEVVEATAFLALPEDEQRARLAGVRVFARTTPEQKLALIRLLKGHFTVGYLGEGINDAPALKAADVSIVVASASDVARETADIALVENDLSVIVEGIRLGRQTHANTMKYIRATLISNFGNFYAVAIGSLFVSFLPMLPKQLLLLNLLSDFPMIAIALDRVAPQELARPQRLDFRTLYIVFMTLGLVSTAFDFLYFALFYQVSPEVLQTNWFMGSVLTELLLILSIRSVLPVERAGLPATPILLIAGLAFALTIALPVIPATAAFFGFRPPSPADLALVIGIALAYFAATEIAKRPLFRLLGRG